MESRRLSCPGLCRTTA